ncbi:dTDP-4-dehydrorhamnose 3,5-epimerase family protein [Undibacterium hunanense]|nr:dTDP-4-dehydrorhamnose 3,5-epimerase family protein [Undibacterium hunanense]
MSGRFDFLATPITGLQLVQRKPRGDQRGYLQRLFCSDDMQELGWTAPIAQINHTYTARKGTLRGLHLQLQPFAEMKLVSCMKGEVWDVAVDLRAGSPHFLQWHAVLLSAQNQRSYLIPAGFAHGFQTMTDDVEMLYCHSQPYMPASEMGVHPMDSRLAITWPLAVSEMSDRDNHGISLDTDFQGVNV